MPREPNPAETSDSALLDLATAGDLDAFAALYRRYQQVVYRFARAMTGSADAAEDITQEVFIALLTQAGRYDPERAAFATYLYGMVRNLSRARLRRESRRLSVETFVLGGTESREDDPASRIENDETVTAVRRALGRLPSRYRELIVLCDLHGLSYQEAAVVVEASVPAVRSRLHRGRQLLKLRFANSSQVTPTRAMHPARCAI
jgi:RNA polymerase sigma-70 factor (ECF subfamily)